MDERDGIDASRRRFLRAGGALAVSGLATRLAACRGRDSSEDAGPPERFDVIIIGTGFGGTLAAVEIARAHPALRILIIERGVFWTSPDLPVPHYLRDQPVQYWPRHNSTEGLRSFLSNVHPNVGRMPRMWRGRGQPLYRYNTFPGVHILTASGVGGGSLISSGVSLEPYFDPDARRYPVMDDWPFRLDRDDFLSAKRWMSRWIGRPSRIVTKAPLPADREPFVEDLSRVPPTAEREAGNDESRYLPRSLAFKRACARLSGEWKARMVEGWQPLDLQVTERRPGEPDDLKTQRFCRRQGRCTLGCLPGARQTLDTTLVERLLTNPALHVRLQVLTEVLHVSAAEGGGYQVVHRHAKTGARGRSIARVVILAAGVIGTTEILLRSKALDAPTGRRLTFSDALGSGFSTNGDASGFVINIPRRLPDPREPTATIDNRVLPTQGPINTSHATFRRSGLLINVEDAGVPAMFASATRATLDVLARAGAGRPSLVEFVAELGRLWASRNLPALMRPRASATPVSDHEAIDDVFWFNCMGTDRVRGRFDLGPSGRLTLGFPGDNPLRDPVFDAIEDLLRAMADAMGGRYVPFPLVSGLTRRALLVAHPLGGCPIGRTSTDGAADRHGRVFNTRSGADAVHPGLYVMDGSLIPGPLAVNPTLTIVATALKVSDSVNAYLAT